MAFIPKKADAALMAEPSPKRAGRPSPFKNTKLTDLRQDVAQAIRRYYRKQGVPGVLAHLTGEPVTPEQIRSSANKLGIHADRAAAHKRAAATARKTMREKIRAALPTLEQIDESRAAVEIPACGVIVCTGCLATNLNARQARREGWAVAEEKHKGATTHIGACPECQKSCDWDESWSTQSPRK